MYSGFRIPVRAQAFEGLFDVRFIKLFRSCSSVISGFRLAPEKGNISHRSLRSKGLVRRPNETGNGCNSNWA